MDKHFRRGSVTRLDGRLASARFRRIDPAHGEGGGRAVWSPYSARYARAVKKRRHWVKSRGLDVERTRRDARG